MRGGIELTLWGRGGEGNEGEGYTMGCVYLHECIYGKL